MFDVFVSVVIEDLIMLKFIMIEMMYGNKKDKICCIVKCYINEIMEMLLVRIFL